MGCVTKPRQNISAGALPENKARIDCEMQDASRLVALASDDVNDAPRASTSRLSATFRRACRRYPWFCTRCVCERVEDLRRLHQILMSDDASFR
jgi:hypothetical protein